MVGFHELFLSIVSLLGLISCREFPIAASLSGLAVRLSALVFERSVLNIFDPLEPGRLRDIEASATHQI